MKRLLCVALLILILVLSGCSQKTIVSNNIYSIEEGKDGEYVMNFHDPADFSNSYVQGSERPPQFIFNSLAHMKQTIENGTFSAKQQRDIQKFFGKRSGTVRICNINGLFDARLPENCVSSTVHWYGSTYSIDFGDGTVYGTVNLSKEAGVKWEEESWGNRTKENSAISIISEETEASRNASVIVFDAVTVGQRWKEIRYNYSSGDTNMVILERYLCSASETVPQAIYLWGQSSGEYFTVYLYGLTERPSYEWITAFGLKPYVEEKTS